MATSINKCPVCGGKEWDLFRIDLDDNAVNISGLFGDVVDMPDPLFDPCIVDLPHKSWHGYIDECVSCGTTINGLDPGVL